jgi:hypothetical protein
LKNKWWFPKFGCLDWAILALLIFSFSLITFIAVSSSNRDKKCEGLGGVSVQGKCFKKEFFINMDAE